MPTTNLSFAKIAATPTESAWSQAYNSGSLFITLALASDNEASQEQLPSLGKTVLGLLESEIYGLEVKNIAKINEVLTLSVKDLPSDVTPSLSLCFVKENALYAFVLGTGTILLKRGEKIGPILDIKEPQDSPTGGSGYLETNDLVLIQTAQFARSVSEETVTKALEYGLPNDIAETISPHVHGKKEGGAALIILCYKGVSRSHEMGEDESLAQAESEEPAPVHANIPERELPQPISQPMREPIANQAQPSTNRPMGEVEEGEPTTSPFEKITSILSRIRIPFVSELDGRKKITLAVATLLIVVLGLSIIFVSLNQESSKNKALFASLYSSAKDDYEAGSDLLSLNPSLARDDLLRAQETIAQTDGKFKDGSTEKAQIDELKMKIEDALSGTENKESITPEDATKDDAPALTAMASDSKIVNATELEGTSYLISETSIIKIEKDSNDKEVAVKNDSFWTGAKSIGAFGSNLYVLDKESIIKLVPTGTTFANSDYLKEDADLKEAVSMTIDSSIYVLFKDGSISKFTKGTKDTFSVSGVTDAFSFPTAIVTTEDADKILVLDPKNHRLVALNKDGSFSKQYQSDIFSGAKTITLSQDGKIAYVLSGKKVSKISL